MTKKADKPNSELGTRLANTGDLHRAEQATKRHQKSYNTARENISKLCDGNPFNEYGQLAVAAQRQRKSYEDLQTETAADGVITGVTAINTKSIELCEVTSGSHNTALIVNDYSVMAGTQGYFHHLKVDRLLHIAAKKGLPVIMLTEGGGGRPGDTDVTTINSGLQCATFAQWAGLSGKVPRIALNNGYCFAGNAALFGVADITIATKTSSIGMAGPAMIEGGGLGKFAPAEIGPIDMQARNGVVDIVVEDENAGIELAKKCLGFFQGASKTWAAPDTSVLNSVLPEDRRYVYDVYKIINAVVDVNSFVELGAAYGGAIIQGFARLEGKPIGLIANNCKVLGGAIDVDAANKVNRFMNLCEQFCIPIVSLCDTPGFMVGPEHEKRGAVRHLSQLFTTGANLSIDFIAVVIRKCYGLGAQAMLSGSTSKPSYMLSWPQGEFGPMGLEGAIKLGFKKELAEQTNDKKRQALFDKLLAQQYEKGKAIEVATMLEIDAVIEPSDTRSTIIAALG
ncbi:acyl-CoA carboxylase subunit beta [Glaciecola sp. SC05]|uniref:acyl-CoA carboxylase subunit beta n=1 Tax=Glaciecola sp. SC05 TaxID=1987355 RepID=UPI003529206E